MSEKNEEYWRERAEETVDAEMLEWIRYYARKNAYLPDH